MARYGKADVLEAAQEFEKIVLGLRSYVLSPGRVYASVVSVSRSGMSRKFEFWVVEPSDKPSEAPWLRRITHLVATLSGCSRDRKSGALRIDGCGMDMGFAALDHALRGTERALGREYNSLKQISPDYL